MPADPNRVRDVFLAAVELPPERRPVFLADACGPDPDLRAEVERLLTAHADPDSPLEPPSPRPTDATGTFAPDARRPVETATGDYGTDGVTGAFGDNTLPAGGTPAPAAGAVIAGRYILFELIGEGGMGSVYLASQTEPVKRQVALKLIKSGMDSKAVLARFDAERQALAMMDHPNIARVYDGGTTPFGQPFFAMELVKGVPLTTYCDRHRLSVRARLELFVQVCQAVQHAHQKGVIHRDLKPGNVLVTEVDGRPTPKVIDFGVAKATEQKLTDLSFSDIGAIVGTPAYMSPEQADPSSMDIDTRTDVYALGVMLYELLVGSPPIDGLQFKRGAILEMLRMVREVEPPRPSTRLSTAGDRPNIAANRAIEPAKLAELLHGELDWVVMKALEKDRTRRYETANGLARDVQRYLADEVVEARPPSRWYKARKFVRRNRGPVLAASLVLLALVGGIAGTSWGLYRALAAESLAGDRLTQVERARGETETALSESEAARAKTEEARKQAAAVADYLVDAFRKPDPVVDGRQLKVVELLDKAADKLAADKGMDALTRARLQDTLGQTFFGLGLPEKALPLQEKALAAYRSELGPDNPVTLGVMHRLSFSLGHADRHGEAIRVGEDALARRKAVLGPDHPDTLLTMSQLAGRYWSANRLGAAIPMAEQALAGQRKIWGPEHNDLPNSITNMGMLYQAVGRTAEAVKLHEEAVAVRKATKGLDHPDTLLAVNFLGRAYEAAGRTADAIALQRDTVGRMEEKFGPDHPRTLAAMSNLAQAYYRSGKAAEALPVSENALRLAKGAKVPNADAVLGAMQDLAMSYSYLNRTAESLALLREVMTTAAAKFGPNHDTALTATHNLGVALRKADKVAEAIPVFEQALAAQKAIRTEGDPGMLRTMTQLASAYDAAGRATDAIPLLEKVLAVQKAKLDPDHRDLLVTMATLGLSYGSAGRTGDAVRMHEQVVAAFRSKFGPTHPDTQTVVRYLAAAYQKDDRLDAAATAYRDLLTATRPALPADSPDLAQTLFGLGEVLQVAQRFPEAETALQECLTIREKKAPDDWRTFHTKSLLGGALLGQKKYAAAEPLLVAGYEGMKRQEAKIPPRGKPRLPEAVERLVQLGEALGQKDVAAKWRAERAKYPPPQAPPPRAKK